MQEMKKVWIGVGFGFTVQWIHTLKLNSNHRNGKDRKIPEV